MTDEIGNNFSEKLVELVGRHRVIYDTREDGYSNFLAQDETWRKIANELKEDVAACKLKWKNIRSCYTRYLRQLSQSPKTTKRYYLAKHLKFLLPFCKPNLRLMNNETYLDENSSNQLLHYEEELEVVKNEQTEDGETSASLQPVDEDCDQLFVEEINTNNKRPIWETNSEYESYKKTKFSESDEAELSFFRSLLPDIRKMDGRQRNQLKIAVLHAIDSILYSEGS